MRKFAKMPLTQVHGYSIKSSFDLNILLQFFIASPIDGHLCLCLPYTLPVIVPHQAVFTRENTSVKEN